MIDDASDGYSDLSHELPDTGVGGVRARTNRGRFNGSRHVQSGANQGHRGGRGRSATRGPPGRSRGAYRGEHHGLRGNNSRARGASTTGRLGSFDTLYERGGGGAGRPMAVGSLMDLRLAEDDYHRPPRERGRSRGIGLRFHSETGDRRHRPRVDASKEGDSRSGNTGGSNRRKRDHPVGLKVLAEWSTKPPDVVIYSLLDEMSGVRELLAEDTIPDDKMVLFIRVLALAATCSSCRQTLFEVFTLVFTADFVGKLVRFQMSLVNSLRGDLPIFLENQLQLLKAYRRVCQAQARELLPALVQSVELILPKIMERHLGLEEMKNEYEQLLVVLTEEHEKIAVVRSRKLPLADRLARLDDLEPEDDYRDLPIEPTTEDFSMLEAPILRRNIVHGAYKDVHNYLDVQFRLLREDFIRPLREGVCQVKSGQRGSKDVRVYRQVTFQETKVVFGELVHFVKLNLPKTFRLESSKRLLFGNVMCFSADEFKTYFMATVAGKDEKKLKHGLVGVKLLDKPKFRTGLTYTAVESRAFFVSYKHVLKAIQLMDENSLPLAEHIVTAQKVIEPPQYLLDSTIRHYDLRVVLNTSYMKASNKGKEIFAASNAIEPPVGSRTDLQAVPVLNASIAYWPQSADFGLDKSQRDALHAALTKRLVIIQGPPGTGKTFLGLKITQVLLHNSHAWARKETEIRGIQAGQQRRQPVTVEVEVASPILVLCYTNHALDQFLEGMMKFTQRIIRVGSRSKSEDIQQYQINEFLSTLKKQRRLPSHVHNARNTVRTKISDAEKRLTRKFSQLEEVSKNEGLVSWALFTTYGIIPPAIANQLKRGELYRSWILPVYQQDYWREFTYDVREVWSTRITPNNSGSRQSAAAPLPEDDNDEEWHDALEMLREAENERMVDLDYDLFVETAQISDFVKTHEVTLSDPRVYQHHLECNLIEGIITEEEARTQLRTFDEEQEILKRLLRFCEQDFTRARDATIKDNVLVFDLAFKDRWLLYAIWKYQLMKKMRDNIFPEEERLQELLARNQEVKNSEYLHVARQADVVGLTTTGAAQFHAVVQELKPRIVIIEEAAEILEAHVIASLNAHCEHLIMIGDHQQLKPSPAVYQLAKHYGLDTSLFERMINNGVAYQTLQYQHRMRPEISSLLVPSIYENLKDHASVHDRPHIRGVEKSVFFISHTERELAESDDNNSHSNVHEATFIMRLARHLVLQGYSTEQITVLTPYSGQFFLLKKEQRKYNPTCDGMRISIVDNFQGEENDIILLSLVRSNDKGNVGFLKIENRVCVALSRAKFGLFIVGNIDQLRESSALWVKIEQSLKKVEGVGDALVLRCSNHPDQRASVKTEEDMRIKSPEGGCRLPCSVTFPRCGHPCPRMCHPDDPTHTKGKCREPCAKKCDKRAHQCLALCFEQCPPCTVKVAKTLPCEHTHLILCHIPRQIFNCPSKVNKVIEACSHTAEMPCSADPAKVRCPLPCDVRLDCGHSCDQFCHVKEDPEHLKYLCQAPCTRKMKGCSQDHKCTLLCYNTCLDCIVKVEKKLPCGHKAQIPCKDPVEGHRCIQNCRKLLECGHHCPRRCCEPCGGCTVKVTKSIAVCGHQIQTECSKTLDRSMCTSKECPRLLPCGHKCPRRCSETCGGCQEIVTTTVACRNRNHKLKVPCYSLPMAQPDYSMCRAPCTAKLQCEHPCKGTCGVCFHGRFHTPCAQKCDRVLVCGHVCKSPCSAVCPPCQDKCRWKCIHSRCSKTCGIECTPCQEPCPSKCEHQEVSCSKRCGEACDCKPCEEPCPEVLNCGHPCMGLCGDPCPPLCRHCHNEQLTEYYLLGNENEPDARFVLLQDCGHVIEYEGLSGWLNTADDEVQMKRCPRCQEPIYNNNRFKQIVLQSYKDVQKVRFKHFNQRSLRLRDTIVKCTVERLSDTGQVNIVLDSALFFLDCIKKSLLYRTIINYLEAQQATAGDPKNPHFKTRPKTFKFEPEKLHLFNFQMDVIIMAKKIYKDVDEEFKADVERVLVQVMKQTVTVVRQYMEEVECELQRIRYTSEMKSLRTRSNHPGFQQKVQQIDSVMCPTRVFTGSLEKQVKGLLKECEGYVGGLGVSDEERQQIVKAMLDIRKGAWFKCPNGHIYCIADCGGAMVESRCSECGAAIGGASHRLLGDNTLASEMDGASTFAWPQ